MAILYDFLEVAGGAERVTLELANGLNQRIIVAGVNDSVLKYFPNNHTEIQSIASISKVPIWKSIKAIHAFENLSSEFLRDSTNLFSGNNALVAVKNSQASLNYYYCHTPPRFAYDLFDHYQQTLPFPQSTIVSVFANWLRPRYENALRQMDAVFCNSINVQKRLKHFLNIDAEVIYPPVKTERYHYKESNGFYLSPARLENYKRVEIIVDAFKVMPDKKLVVASGGSLFEKLKKETEGYSNIKITGWLEEDQLVSLFSDCIATIYIPIDEDFGMTPIESFSAGKPVIGVNDGGVAETVIHNQTGWLCPKNISIEDVIEGVNFISVGKAESMRTACEERAKLFDSSIFFNKFERIFARL